MIKQDLRVKRTLKQIDLALLNLLAEMPFEKITVDQLCQTALINRSTFYKYYKNKNDLMKKYLDHIIIRFKKHIDAAFSTAVAYSFNEDAYQKKVERLLKFMYLHKEEYTILWEKLSEESVFVKMTDAVRDNMLESLSSGCEGGFTITPQIELYAGLLASDMLKIVRWWFVYENEISLGTVKDIMVCNLRQGMYKSFCGCSKSG